MDSHVTDFVIRAKARIAKNKAFYGIMLVNYVLMFAMFRHIHNVIFV